MRNILFSSKLFNVEVQDPFGTVLICFTNVPGNTKDEALMLVRSKLVLAASIVNTGTESKSVEFLSEIPA